MMAMRWSDEGDAFNHRLVIGAAFRSRVTSESLAAAAKDTPMGKSFYTGTDAELRDGAQVFATKISAAPLTYGLTAPEAASYETLNDTWQAAMAAISDPSTRTKPKIAAKNSARDAIRAATVFLADRIYGTPSVTDEMKLDLGLSVRKDPEPAPAPGQPYMFEVNLAANGWLELGWKCNNPAGTSGTMYMVWRRVAGEADFTFLGGVGAKKYVDQTIPAGASSITYQLQAVRSTAAGPWAQYNVNFGLSSGGGITTSVTEGVPSKIAA